MIIIIAPTCCKYGFTVYCIVSSSLLSYSDLLTHQEGGQEGHPRLVHSNSEMNIIFLLYCIIYYRHQIYTVRLIIFICCRLRNIS